MEVLFVWLSYYSTSTVWHTSLTRAGLGHQRREEIVAGPHKHLLGHQLTSSVSQQNKAPTLLQGFIVFNTLRTNWIYITFLLTCEYIPIN